MVSGGNRYFRVVMLLEQVLLQPANAPGLMLRAEVYDNDGQAALIKDVLAAANAEGPALRHVLFGVEELAGRIHVLGLAREALDRFRELAQGLGEYIEPTLQLTPVFADANGQAVAALEIGGCSNPPYTVRQRVTEDMRTGACWVQAEGDLRPARREDLERIYARRAASPPVPVEVGLNEDPRCLQIQLTVPDTSQAPSQQARAKLMSAIDAKKTAARMLGGEDTGLARLAHARIFGADEPFVRRGVDTLVEQYNDVTDEYRDADRHYYYEQQAVNLNFTIRNNEVHALEDVQVQLTLPQARGLDLADRLYLDADGGHSAVESRLAGYPEVEKGAGRAAAMIRIGVLSPGEQRQLCDSALRLHVGPEMRGMKVAIKYCLTARGLDEPLKGRLKLVFRR